jgi:O6-methylguanine-DNA--protein-cysteine methyltransferase
MQEDKHCTVVVPTMLGRIMCVGDSRAIYSISLRPSVAQLEEANDEAILPPLMQEVRRQLEAYFAGKLTSFDLPYRLTGTPFQRAGLERDGSHWVWPGAQLRRDCQNTG